MRARRAAFIGASMALATVAAGATAPASAASQTAQPSEQAATQTDSSAEAVAFVEDVIDRAAAALTDARVEKPQRIANFQKVLAEALALSNLAKFMVGPDVYAQLSEAQRTRYDALFPDYITRQYAKQFDDILGRPLEVTETTPFRRDIFIRTQFIREEGSPINVDWRARKLKSGEHKLIDIIVNGASIMKVKQSEFAGFISRNGVDALLDRLERDIAA